MSKASMIVGCASAWALAWAAPGQAQSTGSSATQADVDEGQLSDIVVTATKRLENVQDVPIAITAFSAEALQSKGITEIAAVGNLAPNVTLDAGTPFAGSSSVLSAYIRGIGQNDFAFNLDPGVGVYLDGVYLARSVGANQDLLDIERVEILKGPQGTLFGRNTIGGAISIVTRRPGSDLAFRGEVTTGRYDRLDAKGVLDLPIAANLLSTLSFSTKNRKGFQRQIRYPGATGIVDESNGFLVFGHGRPDTFGGNAEWAVRGKLLWEASDAVDVTLTGDYLHQDNNGVANNVLRTYGTPNGNDVRLAALYNLCVNTPAAVLSTIALDQLCGKRFSIGTPLAGRNVDADPSNNLLTYDDSFVTRDIDTSYATGNNFSRMTNYGFGGTIDWDLGAASLKSITAYRRLIWRSALDADGSPLALFETSFETRQRQFSQELQLTGDALSNRLRYVLGVYYFTESGNLHDAVTFPGGLLQVDGNNLLDTKAYAAYANLNYALTDRFSVTLGARYTHEKKTFEGFQNDPNGLFYKLILNAQPSAANRVLLCNLTNLCYSDPNNITRVYPVGENRLTFNNFSPKVGLEFKPNNDVLIYGSYAQGYKTGGWTTRLTAPSAAGATAPSFGPEKASTWELGTKTELANRRVILNIAGFYTTYDGVQLNFQVGSSPTLANAGDAEIYGFEAELQARPVPPLTLQAALGYTHARYTNVLFNVTGVTVNSSLPKTPEWKFSFSPQYTIDLGGSGSILLNADYTHTTSLFNDTENTALLKRPATNMLNASLTYRAPDSRWELVVGGTNLTDDRYLVTGHNQVVGGVTYGTYSRPTEWYATVRVRF